MDRIKRLVKWHYSSTYYDRPERQLQREKVLVPGVPFNRWYLMPAALIIQICCGSLYAWSGYNQPIERAVFGPNLSAKGKAIDRGQASNVFFVAVAVFGCTAALLGPWLERNGPLKGALLGASLFFIGNMLTAVAIHVENLPLVFFGYGFVGGAGLGISYISPVSPLQKWFPDYRGLAAGLAVCGFGAGSIFSPYTQKGLIGSTYANTGVKNLGVPLAFVITGVCYFVLMSAAAFVLRMPPPGYSVNGVDINTVKGAEASNIPSSASSLPDASEIKLKPKNTEIPEDHNDPSIAKASTVEDKTSHVVDVQVTEGSVAPKNSSNTFAVTLSQALTSREYILMYIMFFCNEITGLLIISKIQSIVQNQLGKSEQVAADINSILGGCNLLGRLILPTLSDYIGTRKPLFILSLAVQTVFLAVLPKAIGEQMYGLVLTCAFFIAFFYGGGFGLIPAFLADQFGSKNVGATHGVILTAWALASVGGGLIFNDIYKRELARLAPDLLHVYDLNFHWIVFFTALGFVLTIFIPTSLRDRRLPKKHGELLRFRFVNGRMIRVLKSGGIRQYTKAEEEVEWQDYLRSLETTNQVAAPR
ncbi:major facilitator superfamily domain-containing protein [Phlyctochytrium arcticum]|nr:major facilitator superfamily domain-containing protein [Phlyctochytrium arcticum]